MLTRLFLFHFSNVNATLSPLLNTNYLHLFVIKVLQFNLLVYFLLLFNFFFWCAAFCKLQQHIENVYECPTCRLFHYRELFRFAYKPLLSFLLLTITEYSTLFIKVFIYFRYMLIYIFYTL